MTTTLEHNNQPAEWSPFYRKVINEYGIPITPGAVITLCAWCSKHQTDTLKLAGYSVSHGICKECYDDTLNKVNYYIKNSPDFASNKLKSN
jgi:hypothetical protein